MGGSLKKKKKKKNQKPKKKQKLKTEKNPKCASLHGAKSVLPAASLVSSSLERVGLPLDGSEVRRRPQGESLEAGSKTKRWSAEFSSPLDQGGLPLRDRE